VQMTLEPELIDRRLIGLGWWIVFGCHTRESGFSTTLFAVDGVIVEDAGRAVGLRKFYSWEYSHDEEGSIALEHASFPSPHRKSLESIRKPVVAQREQRFSDRYLVTGKARFTGRCS
ncbi:MAG: hypothetical protein KDE58_07735, partial [Caldilineaceae bacterium]|nr:hypothetical protein [Caldilineaceae bacterium]